MRWLAFVVLLAVSTAAIGERLPIKTYTLDEGLPSDRVDSITQDSTGFLWFGTPEGLSRFDGYNFVNYGTDEGLSGEVYSVLQARDHTYWVATSNGLYRMQVKASVSSGKTFIPYYPSSDRSSRIIVGMAEDPRGTIWLATEDGLFRVDRIQDDWKISPADFIQAARLLKRKTIAVAVDSIGNVWVAAESGLYIRNPDGAIKHYLPSDGVPILNCLSASKDGRMWGGSPIGIYEFGSPSSGKSLIERIYTKSQGLISNGITAICAASNGKVWAGSGGSLNAIDVVNGTVATYGSQSGISGGEIGAIKEDRDGNIWVGTNAAGAIRIAANGFTTFTESDGLVAKDITSIFENQARELVVLGEKSTLQTLKSRKFVALKLKLPAGINDWGWGWNQVSFQDHLGDWWLATAQGLVRYASPHSDLDLAREPPKDIYTKANGLPSNEVFRLYEDSRGDIWIGTLGNSKSTVTRWDRSTRSFHSYPIGGNIPESGASAFREDSHGSVWIGLYIGGVLRYEQGKFDYFSEKQGAPHGFVTSIFLDSKNRLWIATLTGGVSRIDDPASAHPTFVHFSPANGLASNEVNCITEDRSGAIYLGTGRGIDKIDPLTGSIAHYSSADGLASSRVIEAFCARDGSLWFGTQQGLSHYVPDQRKVSSPPTIVIDHLRIAGVEQPVGEIGTSHIEVPSLPPSKNDVEIEFAGLSLAVGESIKYQYKLQGGSSVWSTPSNQRTVNYANLPPGRYVFQVRAISSSGLHSQQAATVTFTILRPVWQRWWFISLVLVAIALAAYLIDRYRVAKLLEVERVRTRIATDLHDDIGASLSRMAILSEVVKQTTAKNDVRSAGMLTEIADSARNLVDSMSDIVWSIDPNKDDLRNVLSRVRALASDVLEPQGIHWEMLAPAEIPATKLNPEQRRHLYLIFKEAISNIAKHAHCGRVQIEVAIKPGGLFFAIKDDGKGMAAVVPGDRLGGNGLRNMSSRAGELGGKLSVNDEPGGGTCIKFSVPHR